MRISSERWLGRAFGAFGAGQPGWLAGLGAQRFGVLAVLLGVIGGGGTAASEPVGHLIAVVATANSVHQPHGHEVVDGVKAAVARINARGGILGAPLRIDVWEEDCGKMRALEVASEIAALKPALVIGHLCTGAAIAAAPIYEKAGILLIAPGVRHPALTAGESASKLVLRLAGRSDRFAADALALIAARYAGQSVALIGDRTRQGRSLADDVIAEARRRKVAIALDVRIESGEKSYAKVAQRVKDSGAGVIIMPAQPVELGVLVTDLRRLGVGAPVVGSVILAVPAIEVMAREEGERFLVMMPWSGLEFGGASLTRNRPEPEREAVRLRASAAVEVWAAATRRAGTMTAEEVAAAARDHEASTVVGPLRFDEAGDAIVPGFVGSTWRNGTWAPIGKVFPERRASPKKLP